MLAPYRDLLRMPGTLAFTLVGFASRLPTAMSTLGTLLLVEHATDSFAIAGGVTAASGLAHTVAAPLFARWVDRRGQATPLRLTVLAHTVGIVALVLLCLAGAPSWTYFAAAALAGAGAPPIGTFIRARWAHLLGHSDRLQTAYAFESAIDELLFVVGPALVMLLSVLVWPGVSLLVGAVLTVVACFGFAAQARTEPPACPNRVRSGSQVPRGVKGVAVVASVLTALGLLCGSIGLLATALCRELGSPGIAGIVLACWAVGSLASGLIYGAVNWRSSLRTRFVIAVACFAVAAAAIPLAATLWTLIPAMFVVGATISPVLITSFALVERLVPRQSRTEGLTWASTGMSLSGAGAGALAGILVDLTGVSTAVLVSAASGPVALVVAVIGYRWLGMVADELAAPESQHTPDSLDALLPRQRTDELADTEVKQAA